MKIAKLPINDKERIDELRSLELLDSDGEIQYDSITLLAKNLFEVPIALISLVDEKRQWFKSKQGLDVCETDRDIAFCSHAILQNELFVVEDATTDERFKGNPLVLGDPQIRFYAGYPLKLSSGFIIGTLCIIDTKKRKLSESETEKLILLGQALTGLLEQHRANKQQAAYAAMLEKVHFLELQESNLEKYLEIGLEVLDLQIGMISHIYNENYKIVASVVPGGGFPAGTILNLKETYCEKVYQTQSTVFFDHAGSSKDINTHIAYKNFGLETWVGTPVTVAGKFYGTLNFSQPEVRKKKFTFFEINFLKHLAQSIGKIIELQKERINSQQISEILDHTPEFIGIADLEHESVLYLNNSFKDYFSASAFESLNFKNIHPDWAAKKLKSEAFPHAIEHGIWQGESAVKTIDNGERPVFQTLMIKKDPQGKPKYISTIMHDISENKAYEQELIKNQEKAQMASAAKTSFLANMSHEIRTPLNAIIGYSELLSETNLSAEQAEMMNNLVDSSNFLLELVNDILDLSKIEADEIKLLQDPVCFKDVIEKVVELFEPQFNKKNVKFVTEFCHNITGHFLGDHLKIQQIVVNLVSNALKFTDKGQVKLYIGTNKSELPGNIYLEVSDTGIGIPEERLEDIFDSFKQAEDYTTKKYGGTGLGLAIVKKLCHKMGGDIIVESKIHKGSKFKLTLNLQQTTTPGPEEKANTKAKNLKTSSVARRILIVDDNTMNRKIVAGFLKNTPYLTDEASDGFEALEKMKINSYDLVLMDMQMPGLNGFETTAQFREIEQKENRLPIKIIALSAFAFDEEVNRSLSSGCDEYLSKPIRKAILLEALDKALN